MSPSSGGSPRRRRRLVTPLLQCCITMFGCWFVLTALITWKVHTELSFKAVGDGGMTVQLNFGSIHSDFSLSEAEKTARTTTRRRSTTDGNNLSTPSDSVTEIRSSNKNQEVSPKEATKPTFVLHLGPSKTGTTALQCSLSYSLSKPSEKKFFDIDRYQYLGTAPIDCAIPSTSMGYVRNHPGTIFYGNGRNWTKLQGDNLPYHHIQSTEVGRFFDYDTVPDRNTKGGREHYLSYRPDDRLTKKFDELKASDNPNEHGILVFEGFDRVTDDHIEKLKQALDPYWNVKIILNYRRLFEWLPSFYSEVYRQRDRKKYVFPQDPSDTSLDIKPFALDDRDMFTLMVQELERHQKHPSQVVQERFAKQFDDISVLDIHQYSTERAYKEVIFCNVLDNAPRVCQALQDGSIQSTSGSAHNPSFEFDYDLLAMAAFRQKLFRTTHTPAGVEPKEGMYRSKVFRAISYRQEALLKYKYKQGYPLECLPQEALERIFALSWISEQGILGEKADHDKHREAFDKQVEKQKYCSINAEQTLAEGTSQWKTFLSLLNDCEDYDMHQQAFYRCIEKIHAKVSGVEYNDSEEFQQESARKVRQYAKEHALGKIS